MQSWLDQTQQWLQTHVLPYGENLLWAAIILLVGNWIAKRLCAWLERRLNQRGEPTLARFLARLAYIALLIFLAIAALDKLGIETTSLVAIFGAASLAVGFALKDSLSNFAAGVMLALFRPFEEGHYVEAGGTAGTVSEIRIFATRFFTPDNKLITVPNGGIMNGTITNYTAMQMRRVDMVFRVSYDSDLARARSLFLELIHEDDRVLAEPEPVVVVGELGESAVYFWVRPWTQTGDYWPFKWDYTERAVTRLRAEGIDIPFPQMGVSLTSSTTATTREDTDE